jgi:hypothetical protein
MSKAAVAKPLVTRLRPAPVTGAMRRLTAQVTEQVRVATSRLVLVEGATAGVVDVAVSAAARAWQQRPAMQAIPQRPLPRQQGRPCTSVSQPR